jgi:hypothetical protein
MHVIKKELACWYLELDKSDRLEDVVEAIARASFETATPAGISAITSFKPNATWSDVRLKALSKFSHSRKCLLQMDYVAGRRCKTTLVMGRKYLRFWPGDGRESQAGTIYLLATKYLMKRQMERVVSAPLATDRVQ